MYSVTVRSYYMVPTVSIGHEYDDMLFKILFVSSYIDTLVSMYSVTVKQLFYGSDGVNRV